MKFEHWEPVPGAKCDCAVRSIMKASGLPYEALQQRLEDLNKFHGCRKYRISAGGACDAAIFNTLELLGWRYVECSDLFKAINLPAGQAVLVLLRGHIVFVDNNTVYDQWDCRGQRSPRMRGYFVKKRYGG